MSVEHVDGRIVETTLPELIDPLQPFKRMRAITHTVRPGLTAECRMEGDTFEMEDQRNWSDASYKTYVRPLELPWPYRLKSDERFRQKVTLTLSGAAMGEPSAGGGAGSRIRIELGKAGAKLPAIGVVIYPEDASAALENVELLRQLAPQHLLFHFDPTVGHGIEALRAYAAVAAGYPVSAAIECVVTGGRDLDAELSEVAARVRDAGLKLAGIVVSPSADRQSTPPGSQWPECPPLDEVYAAARRAFPGLQLGGGMLSYFTELNRKRVPAGELDFITHCTCPIVHAGDDLSVMQSLEALPFITRSVRAIYGDKRYRIGPSTIAMRQNPYGSATKDNPRAKRMAMANRDPRHGALFAAAWSLGYAARVAAAGPEQLILSGFAGPFGVIAGQGEPVPEGKQRPLFHVVQGLAAMAGLSSVEARSSAEHRVATLAGRSPDGRLVLWLANLTPAEVIIDLTDLAVAADAQLTFLDTETLAAGAGAMVEAGAAKASVRLAAYSVARIA